MRAVVQRVTRASVTVDGAIVGAIDAGLLVYLGVGKGDGPEQRAYVLDKILNLRIFENDAGKMDTSVLDSPSTRSLLVVSQFTLYADLRRGRRPSFDDAMPPGEAEPAYQAFLTEARARGVRVEAGTFRAHMLVESCNDGPVTICFDTSAAT
jgi:D-tyrosyl-tRNA(Tyr) deacylase